VLDSVGVGSLPDAAAYGDEGANTLGHIADRRGGLKLPHLAKLGLGNIIPVLGVAADPAPLASWGRMAEMARGKDTLAGHWELMGIVLEQPFSLFPRGFPADLLAEFKRRTGVAGLLGNKAASGTEIIAELGAEHAHRFSHRLHLSRQRAPDRRARKHHPVARAVRDVPPGQNALR
jgi:phosphopentomutase